MERSVRRTCVPTAGIVVAVVAMALALGGFARDAQAAFSLADLADEGSVAAAEAPVAPGGDGAWDVVGSLGDSTGAHELDQAIEVGQLVVYEAAGVSIELPAPLSVIELPGVFVMGAYGDFFVALTQEEHDFVRISGSEAVEEFLAATEEEGLAPFTFEVAGGGEGFGCTIEEEGMETMDLYVVLPNGDLTSLWIEYPTDQGAAYIAASALVFNSLCVVDPLTVAAEAELSQAAGEAVVADGLSFVTPAMAWDTEVEGWLGDDALVFAYTIGDAFEGETDLLPADLDAYASALAEPDGLELSSSVLVNPHGDHTYVYAALYDADLMEVYAFTPLPDGTVTLLCALCDASDPEAVHALGVLLQSIAIAPQDASSHGAFGGLFERLGVGKAADEGMATTTDDLLNNPAFVAASKLA